MLELLIRSTREEAEAGTDGMNGMVRAMLLEKSPRRTSTPHASSHAAGDGEGRTEHRATGHHPHSHDSNRDIAGRNGKIA